MCYANTSLGLVIKNHSNSALLCSLHLYLHQSGIQLQPGHALLPPREEEDCAAVHCGPRPGVGGQGGRLEGGPQVGPRVIEQWGAPSPWRAPGQQEEGVRGPDLVPGGDLGGLQVGDQLHGGEGGVEGAVGGVGDVAPLVARG